MDDAHAALGVEALLRADTDAAQRAALDRRVTQVKDELRAAGVRLSQEEEAQLDGLLEDANARILSVMQSELSDEEKRRRIKAIDAETKGIVAALQADGAEAADVLGGARSASLAFSSGASADLSALGAVLANVQSQQAAADQSQAAGLATQGSGLRTQVGSVLGMIGEGEHATADGVEAAK